jgi:hypothetical protein
MSFATVLTRRLAIVRFVLLALCLNLTAGMALHAAEHLREGAVVSASADEAAEHEDAPVEVCATCLAHAASTLLPDTTPLTRAMPPARTPAPRPGDAAFVPAPAHWRFASRDPPATR